MKSIRTTRTALTALFLAISITGCSGAVGDEPATTTEPPGYALVIGARSNSPVPNWDQINAYLPELPPPGTRTIAIAVDGTPTGRNLYDRTTKFYEYSGDAADAAHSDHIKLKNAVVAAAATVAEADTLGAITLAAATLRGVPGKRTLLVSDSMLSTAGALRFQDNLLALDGEDIVEALHSTGQLPDLTGIDFVILNEGITTPPQQPLDDLNRRRLHTLIETILRAAGANTITYDTAGASTAPDTGLPSVTPVNITTPRLQLSAAQVTPTAAPVQTSSFQNTPNPPPPVSSPECSVTLTNDQIAFEPETAVYLSPSDALTVISAAAEQIAACPGPITVYGTTSSYGTVEGRLQTSTKRAATVRDTLSEALQLDPSTIPAIGLGIDNQWYVNDRDSEGNLDKQLAVLNRTVHIVVGHTS